MFCKISTTFRGSVGAMSMCKGAAVLAAGIVGELVVVWLTVETMPSSVVLVDGLLLGMDSLVIVGKIDSRRT